MSQQAEPVTLRLLTEDDRSFLRRLFHECHAQEFAPLGLPDQALTAMLDMQHRAQTAGYAQQFPRSDDHLLELGGRPVGRILLDTQPDALHLVDLALLPEVRGRGLGSYLLNLVAAQADRHALPVRLTVRCGNPALRLYLRHGFVQTGEDSINLQLERPSPTPLELTSAVFNNLRGQSLRAYAPDGSAAILQITGVSELPEPGQQAVGESFIVEFSGPAEYPLPSSTARLVSAHGNFADVFLSPKSVDHLQATYEAVFNKYLAGDVSVKVPD